MDHYCKNTTKGNSPVSKVSPCWHIQNHYEEQTRNGVSVMGASQLTSAQLSKNVYNWANTKFNKARYRYKIVFQKWIIQLTLWSIKLYTFQRWIPAACLSFKAYNQFPMTKLLQDSSPSPRSLTPLLKQYLFSLHPFLHHN